MFTGIIKEVGAVRKLVKVGQSYSLEVESLNIFKDSRIGDSIAIDGACLTVAEKIGKVLRFDVMGETAGRSTLSSLKSGDAVNMEDSLKAGEPLGGHFVQGHIDCVGRITNIKKADGESSIEIEFPARFARLIAEKGSITIDGISLTVGEILGNRFKVYVIPHTLSITNLGAAAVGDGVNLEFDVIGKYIARFEDLKGGRLTEEFLRDKGF